MTRFKKFLYGLKYEVLEERYSIGYAIHEMEEYIFDEQHTNDDVLNLYEQLMMMSYAGKYPGVQFTYLTNRRNGSCDKILIKGIKNYKDTRKKPIQ